MSLLIVDEARAREVCGYCRTSKREREREERFVSSAVERPRWIRIRVAYRVILCVKRIFGRIPVPSVEAKKRKKLPRPSNSDRTAISRLHSIRHCGEPLAKLLRGVRDQRGRTSCCDYGGGVVYEWRTVGKNDVVWPNVLAFEVAGNKPRND